MNHRPQLWGRSRNSSGAAIRVVLIIGILESLWRRRRRYARWIRLLFLVLGWLYGGILVWIWRNGSGELRVRVRIWIRIRIIGELIVWLLVLRRGIVIMVLLVVREVIHGWLVILQIQFSFDNDFVYGKCWHMNFRQRISDWGNRIGSNFCISN